MNYKFKMVHNIIQANKNRIKKMFAHFSRNHFGDFRTKHCANYWGKTQTLSIEKLSRARGTPPFYYWTRMWENGSMSRDEKPSINFNPVKAEPSAASPSAVTHTVSLSVP